MKSYGYQLLYFLYMYAIHLITPVVRFVKMTEIVSIFIICNYVYFRSRY